MSAMPVGGACGGWTALRDDSGAACPPEHGASPRPVGGLAHRHLGKQVPCKADGIDDHRSPQEDAGDPLGLRVMRGSGRGGCLCRVGGC